MNELLPYEEQLAGRLANIPLPDEDKGWDAMRKMLDDGDDDDVVPPPVNTGCRRGGVGLLLLLLLGGITWGVYKLYIRGSGDTTRDSSLPIDKQLGTKKDSMVADGGKHAKNDSFTISGADNRQGVSNETKTLQAAKNPNESSPAVEAPKESNNAVDSIHLIKKQVASLKETARFGVKNGQIAKGTVVGKNNPNKTGTFTINSKGGGVGRGAALSGKGKNAVDKTGIADSLNGVVAKGKTNENKNKSKDGSNTSLPITPPDNPSSTIKTNTDTINQVKQIPTPEKFDTAALQKSLEYKTEDLVVRNNKFYLSAGLGLQQLIPVDGQKSSPYNAFGRKGSLADYIPSAYFRAHLNHAFLQVEFKYGAPQDTKNIAYSTKVTNYDSTTHITTSQVNSVNKTYYHQLPLSIHYEVLPNLSIGAGAVWNRFQSAVVTQQNQASNGLTGTDSIVNSKVINVKSDSAFAKTYWQFMLEAQYAWKRFSFGTRYAWGLTPYLTATSSSGQTQKERNASLNVFIRYELWRSKKK